MKTRTAVSASRSASALTLCAALGLIASWSPAAAQDPASNFPNHPITIVVGPSPDVVPRVIGEYLHNKWGQAVVVETKPGAGGQIAADTVAHAKPDGYTYLFATPSYTLNTAIKTANYDIIKQFAPTVLLGITAYTLVVNPKLPVHSVAELVAYAKAHPGQLNCGSAGVGTAPHLACEMFNTIPGVKVVHVPYRNVPTAMNGLIANQIQMFVSVAAIAKPQIEAGTVRGIATTGPKRSPFSPQLPTIAESGYPKFVEMGWGGLLATAGTPKPILQKMNAEVRRGLETPKVKDRLAKLANELPPPLDPDGVAAFVKQDLARWTSLVNLVGIDKLRPPQ